MEAEAQFTAVELLDQAIKQIDQLLAGSSGKAAANPSVTAAAKPATAKPAAAKPAAKPAPAPAPAAPTPAPAAAAAPSASQATGAADAALFDKCALKVAKVLTVSELANSEKLFKLSIDVGNGETKQVCAGLKPYIPRAELEGSLVVVITNLKPAKLAGELSEAMILAADTQDASGALLVRTLIPPAGSEPGDVVFLEGGAPSSAVAKQVKSDDWKKIVAALSVQASKATYGGTAFVTAKGGITLPALIPDGAGIH